jgi:hypothetical protein
MTQGILQLPVAQCGFEPLKAQSQQIYSPYCFIGELDFSGQKAAKCSVNGRCEKRWRQNCCHR